MQTPSHPTLPTRRHALRWLGAGLGSTVLGACGGGTVLVWGETPASAASSPLPVDTQPAVKAAAVIVASGLSRPWALTFLPDGRMLVTERTGALRIVGLDGKAAAPIVGVPAVDARGQGGLLDVALDPAFAANRRVYLSYAEAGTGAEAGRNGAAVGNCPPVGGAASAPGMEQPLTYWAPTSIAPCGMAFYTGSVFPQWRGNLFVGVLAGQALWRLQLDGDKVVSREALLTDLGERIRDARQGPDGAIYLISDGASAKIYRLQPV